MKLVPIGLPSEATEADKVRHARAQYVCTSAAKGGVFSPVLNGNGKSAHVSVISNIACALLLGVGKSKQDLIAFLAEPHVSAGNTSAWSKWLQDSVQWELPAGPDGKPSYVSYEKGLGKTQPATNLSDVEVI